MLETLYTYIHHHHFNTIMTEMQQPKCLFLILDLTELAIELNKDIN